MRTLLLLFTLISFNSFSQELTSTGKTWNPETLTAKLTSIVGLSVEEQSTALNLYTTKEQKLWDNKLQAPDEATYLAVKKQISQEFSEGMKNLLGARRYRVWRKRLADERAGIVSPFEY